MIDRTLTGGVVDINMDILACFKDEIKSMDKNKKIVCINSPIFR